MSNISNHFFIAEYSYRHYYLQLNATTKDIWPRL